MARPLRILHVVPYFPPDRVGGVGEVAAHLHRGLLSRGYDSRVLTAGTSHGDPLVHRIAASPVGFVLRCWHAIGLVRDRDVVHCHHGDALLLLLLMRLRRARARILVTFHLSSRGLGEASRPYRLEGQRFGGGFRSWTYRHLGAPVHRFVDWLALRLCDEVSFISLSAARDVLGDSGAAATNVIYNGLPPRAEEYPALLPPATDLLFVGTPGDRKRVTALPFVLRHVRGARPHVRLRIIGLRLEDHAELRGLFDRFDLSHAVVCEGALTSDEVRPFYFASKVLLVPSAYEGLPMVILEALQAGLPCVATRVSGHPEVIENDVNGFLVTLDNPNEMGARCLEILGNPDLQQRMGDRGRRVVAERFSLPRQLDEYVALYNLHLISDPQRRRS